MIDIDNYRRAIEWLRRGIPELSANPTSLAIRLGVLQSFEVTYNISEGLLREAFASLDDQEDANFLSTREVILRAAHDGLRLSSAKRWMHYGFVIESMRESCMHETEETYDLEPELLLTFADELESFAHCLEARGLAIA
jgi:hypothetical protein